VNSVSTDCAVFNRSQMVGRWVRRMGATSLAVKYVQYYQNECRQIIQRKCCIRYLSFVLWESQDDGFRYTGRNSSILFPSHTADENNTDCASGLKT
jgi:hypothetical protein